MLNLQDVERDIDNLHRVQLEIDHIIAEAGPLGVFLVDENGFMIAEAGAIEIDRIALSALVAASFGATAEIARILGEPDFDRLTHQGTELNMFIGKAGARHILIVVFGKETNLGLVKLYAEKVATQIGTIMTDEVASQEGQTEDDSTGQDQDSDGLFPAWLENKE